MDTALGLAARSLLFALVLLLAGAVAWRAFLAPRLRLPALADSVEGDGREAWTRMEHRVALGGLLAAILLLPVLVLRLWSQVRDFRDPFVPFSEDLLFVLQDTFWGTTWTGQAILALVLPLLFLLLVRRAGSRPPGTGPRPADLARGETPLAEWPAPWLATGVAVGLLALGLSLQSHAMSMSPGARPLGVGLDWVHQLAAGAWVGTILFVLLAALPLRGEAGARRLAAQFEAFRPLAIVAVGLLVFAGGILATGHMAGPSDLWTTEWGRTLSGKMAVAVAAIAVGGWNSRKGVPRLASTNRSAPLLRAVALEIALAALVLVLTAVLVTRTIPAGAH